jgi:hypothetical protein
MRYKIDGTQINDSPDGAASVSNLTTAGAYFGYVSPEINVSVHDPGSAIKTNVPYGYVASANTPGSTDETGLTIKNSSGQWYSSSGAKTPVVSIVITSITSNSVQGTFSGTIGSAGGSDVNITDGEFSVVRL